MLEARENTKLLAHGNILKKLLDDFNKNKLSHSIIVSGTKGIGKTTLVYHFINKVLSEEANEKEEVMGLFGDALGSSSDSDCKTIKESETYKKIVAKAHPDLLVIEKGFNLRTKKPEKEIKVDQIRKINEFLSLTSGFSKYRFIVIDSADEMNINAANAILKILEEPPKNSFLFLISHNPGKLLDTIRSRCCSVKVSNLDFDNWKKALELQSKDYAKIKKILKEEGQLEILYEFSEGSVLLASELIEFDTVNIYENLINLIVSPSAERKEALCKKVARKEFPWHLFTHLVSSLLHKVIKNRALFDKGDNTDVLNDLDTQVCEQYQGQGLRILFDKNEYINKMLHGVERSNLDSEYVFNLVIEELVALKVR